jgi:hypothetical protein
MAFVVFSSQDTRPTSLNYLEYFLKFETTGQLLYTYLNGKPWVRSYPGFCKSSIREI